MYGSSKNKEELNMAQTKLPEFREKVDKLLLSFVDTFYKDVPKGDHFLNSEKVDKQYFIRNIIEIILRLRMKRCVDALTIHYFTKHDPVLAKEWAKYADEEMLHDLWFGQDIKKMGVTNEEIYSTEPFFSTKLLQGYFYYSLEHEGRPLASLCSSYFIEMLSLVTQPEWIENCEKTFGPDSCKGQKRHLDCDTAEDHPLVAWNVLATFAKTDEDKEKILDHMKNIYKLFVAYYTELSNEILEKKKDTSPLTEKVLA